MGRTALPGRCSADHFRAVCNSGLAIEGAVLAAEALANHLGFLVDDNCHQSLLPFHPINDLTRADNRAIRTRRVLHVTLLHAIRREKRNWEITVHIGADDRLAVTRNRPGEWLLVFGGLGG